MKKLAKRNKVSAFGQISLYLLVCFLCSIIFSIFVTPEFIPESNYKLLIFILLSIVITVVLVLIFPRIIKNLAKAIKIINSKPEYYLEIDGYNILVHALDKDYNIDIKDIQKINYSYDRIMVVSHLLSMYMSQNYFLNTNSQKRKSMFAMFDTTNEFIPLLKKEKKTKHGIIFITTAEYFFVLPEINNVYDCFVELKNIIGYIPESNTNLNEDTEYIVSIVKKITLGRNYEDLNPDEKSLIDVIELLEYGDAALDESLLTTLKEMKAYNYLNLVLELKNNIEKNGENNDDANHELLIKFYNDLKILDEQDPFYKNYLIPYIKNKNLDD